MKIDNLFLQCNKIFLLTLAILSTGPLTSPKAMERPVEMSLIQVRAGGWAARQPSSQPENGWRGRSDSRFQALNLQNPGVDTIPCTQGEGRLSSLREERSSSRDKTTVD